MITWLRHTPANAISKVSTYCVIPSFSYDCSFNQVSQVIVQYNYSANRNFYIAILPIKPDGCNYVPCIKFRVGTTVYRYKLWDDPDLVLENVELYNNQKIGKNFCIEIWNLKDKIEVSQNVSIAFKLSLLEERESVYSDSTVNVGNLYVVEPSEFVMPLAASQPSNNPSFFFDVLEPIVGGQWPIKIGTDECYLSPLTETTSFYNVNDILCRFKTLSADANSSTNVAGAASDFIFFEYLQNIATGEIFRAYDSYSNYVAISVASLGGNNYAFQLIVNSVTQPDSIAFQFNPGMPFIFWISLGLSNRFMRVYDFNMNLLGTIQIQTSSYLSLSAPNLTFTIGSFSLRYIGDVYGYVNLNGSSESVVSSMATRYNLKTLPMTQSENVAWLDNVI